MGGTKVLMGTVDGNRVSGRLCLGILDGIYRIWSPVSIETVLYSYGLYSYGLFMVAGIDRDSRMGVSPRAEYGKHGELPVL